MRRLLLVAWAAVLPALAHAQTTVPVAGQLVGKINTLIGAQQCTGAAPLDVVWTMAAMPGGLPPGGFGTVRIYASNKKRTATTGTGGDPRTCYLSTDSTTDTTIKSVQLAQFDSVQLLSNQQTIPGTGLAAMAQAFGIDCTAETTSTPIYMCALPYQNESSTTQLGYANGDFTLSTRRPLPPTNVTVESAERALRVGWTEATTGENAIEFRVEAVTADTRDSTPGVPHTKRTNASPSMVGGLKDGVEYDVSVIAISAAGTESDRSEIKKGTPLQTEDFWDWYQRAVSENGGTGGVEQGGCTTGAAGVLGLLGAAALVRVFRRKP
jgi:hypothetical protein